MMTNVLTAIFCFATLAYLVGRRHGAEAAERRAKEAASALKEHYAAHDRQVLQAYEHLRSRYDYLGQRYLSAVRRVRRQRRREWDVGRN